MRQSAKNLLVVAALALFAPLPVEVGLRAAGSAPARMNPNFVPGSPARWSQLDDALGWRNRPGTWQSLECGHAPMTFLEDGRRRSPAEPARAAESVAIFGGSYAQGYSVADDESFVERLNEDFEGVRFRSYGVGGYGTLQSTLLAERVLDAAAPGERPAVVVHIFTERDCKTNVAKGSIILGLQSPDVGYVVPPHVRLRDGELERFPASAIQPWPLARHSALVTLLQRIRIKATHRASKQERIEVTRRLLEEFAEAVEARGAEFVVVVLVAKPAVYEAVFSNPAFDHIDCRNTWRRDGSWYPPELTVCGDGNGHPNGEAHDMWANCLGDWLRARRAARDVARRSGR
jgi:hypothetical protein